MKKIFFIGLCCFSFNVLAHQRTDTSFDPDLCQNGYGSTWVNACICDAPTTVSGKYCNIHITKQCEKNNKCGNDSFCLSINGVNMCAPNVARGTLEMDNTKYVLSDMLLNYESSEHFCKSLGNGYRQATRSDFGCANVGPGCLNTEKVIGLQEFFGLRGFFWLDKKDTQNAYYADINDGTVYETSQNNLKTTQALCIKKEK